MDLGHNGHPAFRQPMDQIELPQRPGAIEPARKDPGHLFGQLGLAASGRQGQLADVEIEIKVHVIDPVVVIQLEGH